MKRAVIFVLAALAWIKAAEAATPILVYHRFGATVADEMTITTRTFDEQLRTIADSRRTVIPARQLVSHLRGEAPPPPAGAVVLTADDGHVSVYTEMFPRVRARRFHVTLFIYPSAISNASYAMTWEQLRELEASGLFDIQSHTYWHANFRDEKKQLARTAYETLVRTQLLRSRQVLKSHFSHPIDLLAWPFGLHDRELMDAAGLLGYVAGFTLGRRPATAADPIMALPRYLITESDRGTAFARLLGNAY